MMSSRRIASAVGVVVGANALMFGAYLVAFPGGFSSSSSVMAEESVEPIVVDEDAAAIAMIVPAKNGVPAEAVASKLVAVFPAPKGTVVTVNTLGVPGLPLDYRCLPTKTSASAVTKSVSVAGGGGKGMSVQARAYPAGMGAVALASVRDQMKKCSNVYDVSSATVGDESVTFSDGGSPLGGGGSGTTTVFRVADMVGVVATRGLGFSESSAGTWAGKWSTILTKDVCAGARSNADDAVRNPLSNAFQGWVRTEKVTLSSEGEIAANTAALMAVRVGAQSGPALEFGALPTTAGKNLSTQPGLDVPDYPSYLQVSVPAKPAEGKEPSFPSSPEQNAPTTLTVADPIGPGCGWTFTGMSVPLYDEAAEAAKAEANRVAAAATLRSSVAGWGEQRWSYLLQYAAYADTITARQQWATAATNTIAVAWWADYETRRVTYEQEYARWQSEYLQWKIDDAICQASKPTPTPTPSPTQTTSPTPTPTPSPTAPTPSVSASAQTRVGAEPLVTARVVSCPDAPKEPYKPQRPTLPRPS